ncbi:LOW QUALITY PROTEIN: hypothetical protein YC2023_081611 [Brassica napus]
MLKDMWSTRCRRACVRSHAKRHTGCHQPELDWLLPILHREGQFRPIDDFYDGEVEALSIAVRPRQSYSVMVKCCPELVQIHGFRSIEVLPDTPPGSPKNFPGAKGGSVQISLSRPVSFFMVKPRFCPSRDQSSTVKSRRSYWVLAMSSPINQLLLA